MCILCNDDAAYEAYMAYLDAMQKKGAAADPNQAMDAALDAMMANAKVQDSKIQDTALSVHYTSGSAPARKPNTPKNPFSCDPVDE